MRRVLVMCLCFASSLAGCAPEGSSAYVSQNIPLDSECLASPDSDVFLAVGDYDIAAGLNREPFCRRSYFMHLLVNSNLKANANDATGRAEPNVLQITDAEVRLIDVEQQALIPFDGRVELPNPFRVKANNTLPPTTGSDPQTGIVAVETIPIGYDEQLGDYVNKQILAEVQIFGTTIGDVEIDFKPFGFPIRICEGCLTGCRTEDDEDEIDLCNDNGAQDGRVCCNPSE